MKEAKRLEKENAIIDAAHKVFAFSGFKNAKMEDIAKAAGITKVTLYTYFQSKENLYMALTYKALTSLIEEYELAVKNNRSQTGLESSIDLMQRFMKFNADNPLYSELLLEYFELVRTTSSGAEKKQRLTAALNESKYFEKLDAIQNVPFKIAFSEIERGQKDGSIVSQVDPMLITLQAWSVGLGFAKVNSSSGGDPIFNIELDDLQRNLLYIMKTFLKMNI